MCKLLLVDIKKFLNDKYYEIIAKEKRKVTIEEFGQLFGAGKSLTKMWLNGQRTPANEYKKRIIEHYGDEAIRAFGDDPDLHAVQENWEYFSPEERRRFRAEAEAKATKNAKRTSKERRSSTVE